MKLQQNGEQLTLTYKGRTLIAHGTESPWLTVGRGKADYQMHKGSFTVEDDLCEKIPLTMMKAYSVPPSADNLLQQSAAARLPGDGDTLAQPAPAQSSGDSETLEGETLRLVAWGSGGVTVEVMVTTTEAGDLLFSPQPQSAEGSDTSGWNRLWVNIPATADEAVFGGGEQFSHFNLRGKKFPLWVSEQGVGRNKKTYETFLADSEGGSGGDYYTTYFPQPTFVSSQKYFFHVEDSRYMTFDFRHPTRHRIEIWGLPESFRIGVGTSFIEVLSQLTGLLGRQPELPSWAYDGVWLGLQGGTDILEAKLQRALEAGLKVAAIWAQDWQGKRVTPFGRQLMWNWRWDKTQYPGLDGAMPRWREQGIRFLGYINCFLAIEGDLYAEASAQGYVVKQADGSPYHIVITSFPAAIVDLTNPAAVTWLKAVIRAEMLDFGLSGWMADFAEYLPTDAVLHDGDAETMHNLWPVLWAKLNREVVEECHRLGDVVFFMRAGYSGSARYTTMMWAGDQNVDWSVDDGLPSVIPAALSLGMSGLGLHHSDIGGYTTMFHIKRSKELFMRWAEQAAFSVVMRTHEGNRPDDNWQFDSDAESLGHFARMSQIHVALKPYLQGLVRENRAHGIPVIRPLFLHYEEEQQFYDTQDAYLLGRDVLVAPVLEQGADTREVTLPDDEWIHLWTQQVYRGGTVEVPAPLGQPPVFFRAKAEYSQLFQDLAAMSST